MRLFARRVIFVVAGGVSKEDITLLKRGFELESAEVFVTTAEPCLMLKTDEEAGEEIYIDFPIECVEPEFFDALVIPDGERSVESICNDPLAISVIRRFYEANKTIIASDQAARVLEEQALYPGQIVVREGSEQAQFFEKIIESITFGTSTGHKMKTIPG